MHTLFVHSCPPCLSTGFQPIHNMDLRPGVTLYFSQHNFIFVTAILLYEACISAEHALRRLMIICLIQVSAKGNVILWKSRSALLPSFREVINVGTFTCPEKVFPSANWQIPSDSEIAFRLGLPEQQCIKGKTDEEGSHSNIKFNMLISMK